MKGSANPFPVVVTAERNRLAKPIGWLLAVITVVLVVANQGGVGIARDETVYMSAGPRYFNWWKSVITMSEHPSRDAVFGGAPGGGNNSEHPPLMKTAFGASAWLFHDKLGLLDELTAFRLPTALLHGLLIGLIYAMTLSIWGFAEAIVAALLAICMPRLLFHAGLACFDAPIASLWFATIFAYWRCLDTRRWPWQAGVVFGLALATKHNALLLPFAFGTHYLVIAIRERGWRDAWRYRSWRVLVSLALLAPLTLYVLWPLLWSHPIDGISAWLKFHTTHVHYNFEYLGDNWNAPRFPWHVALITTLFTVPTATLVAAGIGAYVWIRAPREERSPVLLLALSAAASIGPFFLGSTPIFGAEKHWAPALPTICIAAAIGVVWAARRVHEHAVPALAAIVVLAAGVETITAQPYALTSYTALAGGAPGGADKGMNRQFWGVSARGVLPVLAANASPGTQVYTHDAAPAWGWYQKYGLVPKTLSDAGGEQGGIDRSGLAIVIHEKHFNRHDYMIWKTYKTVRPIFVLRDDGVPIVSVYKR